MAARAAGNDQAGPAGTRLKRDHGRLKRVATGGKTWSDEAEAVFLDALAASSNVSYAAQQSGFSQMTPYYHRRRDAAFAARWDAALAHGYARVEFALVRAAADSMEGVHWDDSRPIPKMSVAEAMNLLAIHRRRVEHRARGTPLDPRTLDQLRASLIRKVEAIRAARAAGLAGVPGVSHEGPETRPSTGSGLR